MKSFSPNTKFCFPWRSYQAEVLKELELHLDDNHLNIVAAPGSGKTILGLEVMLRINKPTLILAPSIAIRNQWIQRFTENFLQQERSPSWISCDIRKPEFLTVSTYQGLHAAFADKKDLEDEEVEDDENLEGENEKLIAADAIIKKLEQKRIQTIIIDEAHHLRNAWWESLLYLKENISKPHVVALTATPPYDVSHQEWKNYQGLCGPIDAEITVPELVLEKNLCPHQDYVFLNSLSSEEGRQVKVFRDNVKVFLTEIPQNQEFLKALENHPSLLFPKENIENILKNPEYFSSIAIFLKSSGVKVSRDFFKIIAGSTWKIPSFSEEWAEILLRNVLYRDLYFLEHHKELVVFLKKRMKEDGFIEKRNVFLRNNKAIKRLLKESINKLNSIVEITKSEHENLKNDLRMVILTDFIRAEAFPKKGEVFTPNRIGVVPIFEALRNSFHQNIKVGILSGSIVVIPISAKNSLIEVAKQLGIPSTHVKTQLLPHDENYCEVRIKGANNQKIVQLMTEVFGRGSVEVLVGTKSLLGEGWDAPSINTLVLASFVGSFVLSNQMRGRAIRMNSAEPSKVSNIWHLASVEKDNIYAGHDFEMLQRRFKAFVGLDVKDNCIESGFERMGFGLPPFSEHRIEENNTETKIQSADRTKIAFRWEEVLKNGKIKKIIPEIKLEKNLLPRNFVFFNTIFALFWRSLMAGFYFFLQHLKSIRFSENTDFNSFLIFIGIGVVIALYISMPGLLKTLWLFLRNGPVSGNMKQIGNVLLKTLCNMGFIKTDVDKLQVISERDKYGMVLCGLQGGTSYEKSLFLDALEEIVNPIDNPRYIITRKSRFNFFLREDFHAVPQIIGTHKKSAAFFALMWSKHVGDSKLIYTRNIKGRQLLLRARQKAMSTTFQKPSERIETWK